MDNALDILKKVGAILENGHFVGASGLHLDTYLNKDFLYPHTKETSRVCRLFAEKYKDAGIETVVAPALGGIILSQWVAYHLSEIYGKEVAGVYTEKSSTGEQVLRRGYDKFVSGKRILILEDIVNTGGSVKEVIRAVKDAGGNIVSVCAMVNRNKDVNEKTFGVPFESLSSLNLPYYSPEACPLCKAGIPIDIRVGHGKKYLESLGTNK